MTLKYVGGDKNLVELDRQIMTSRDVEERNIIYGVDVVYLLERAVIVSSYCYKTENFSDSFFTVYSSDDNEDSYQYTYSGDNQYPFTRSVSNDTSSLTGHGTIGDVANRVEAAYGGTGFTFDTYFFNHEPDTGDHEGDNIAQCFFEYFNDDYLTADDMSFQGFDGDILRADRVEALMNDIDEVKWVAFGLDTSCPQDYNYTLHLEAGSSSEGDIESPGYKYFKYYDDTSHSWVAWRGYKNWAGGCLARAYCHNLDRVKVVGTLTVHGSWTVVEDDTTLTRTGTKYIYKDWSTTFSLGASGDGWLLMCPALSKVFMKGTVQGFGWPFYEDESDERLLCRYSFHFGNLDIVGMISSGYIWED